MLYNPIIVKYILNIKSQTKYSYQIFRVALVYLGYFRVEQFVPLVEHFFVD